MSCFRRFPRPAACPVPIPTSRNHRGLAVLAWLVLALTGTGTLAQSPLPDALPNLNLRTNGSIHAIVRQHDGGVVFGGGFSQVNGTPRSNIARLRPDGTLDPGWNPSADSAVHALAVDDANNAVYVAGGFSNISGTERNHIAKLSSGAAASVDTTWNPSPDDELLALALAADGTLYAGGWFTHIGGQFRASFATVNVSGAANAALANIYDSADYATVNALAQQSDGSTIVGGRFVAANGLPRNNILRLRPDGTLDDGWNP